MAASVDLRTNLTWERLDGGRVDLDFQDLECFMSWSIEEIKNIQLSPDGESSKPIISNVI